MNLGKGIKDGGGYDLSEIAELENRMNANEAVGKSEYQEVDPLFIPVRAGRVARTEELEARSVIIEYDEYDNIISVELL